MLCSASLITALSNSGSRGRISATRSAILRCGLSGIRMGVVGPCRGLVYAVIPSTRNNHRYISCISGLIEYPLVCVVVVLLWYGVRWLGNTTLLVHLVLLSMK